MKKLGKLNLNQLTKAELDKREMDYIKGGACCTCACAYANTGGSSTSNNFNANTSGSIYDQSYSCPNSNSTSDHMNC